MVFLAQSAQILTTIAKMPPDVANKMERAYYGDLGVGFGGVCGLTT